jgi:hypothetical protein
VIQWEGHDAFGIKPAEMTFFPGGPQPEIALSPKEGLRARLARLPPLFRCVLAVRRPRAEAGRRENRSMTNPVAVAAPLRGGGLDLENGDRGRVILGETKDPP